MKICTISSRHASEIPKGFRFVFLFGFQCEQAAVNLSARGVSSLISGFS
jgi:hypothetical protein